MAGQIRQNFRGRITEIDKLLVKSCTKTSSVSKQIYCLNQIGLPLRIASINDICTTAEINGIPLVITKSCNCKPFNFHGRLLFSVPAL